MNLPDAQTLARELMTRHGVADWGFEFDNAKRRAGCCHFTRHKITLSRDITKLNGVDAVQNTILHEIAHAIAGYDAHHGREWREVALSIGCNGKRCHNHTVPEPKFTGTCGNCERVIKKHRRNRVACGKCCKKYNGGKFKSEYLINWAN